MYNNSYEDEEESEELINKENMFKIDIKDNNNDIDNLKRDYKDSINNTNNYSDSLNNSNQSKNNKNNNSSKKIKENIIIKEENNKNNNKHVKKVRNVYSLLNNNKKKEKRKNKINDNDINDIKEKLFDNNVINPKLAQIKFSYDSPSNKQSY